MKVMLGNTYNSGRPATKRHVADAKGAKNTITGIILASSGKDRAFYRGGLCQRSAQNTKRPKEKIVVLIGPEAPAHSRAASVHVQPPGEVGGSEQGIGKGSQPMTISDRVSRDWNRETQRTGIKTRNKPRMNSRHVEVSTTVASKIQHCSTSVKDGGLVPTA